MPSTQSCNRMSIPIIPEQSRIMIRVRKEQKPMEVRLIDVKRPYPEDCDSVCEPFSGRFHHEKVQRSLVDVCGEARMEISKQDALSHPHPMVSDPTRVIEIQGELSTVSLSEGDFQRELYQFLTSSTTSLRPTLPTLTTSPMPTTITSATTVKHATTSLMIISLIY